MTRADLRAAADEALLTAGVLGAVCCLYGLGWAIGTLTKYLGWVLYLAANGAH